MTSSVSGTPDLHPPDPECSVALDLRVYSLTAVKKAVYAVGDVASGLITLSDHEARVDFVFADHRTEPGILRARFLRELVDYDLREAIARETEPLRNLIVAHALSKVPLVHPELETGTPEMVAPESPEPLLPLDDA